MAASSPACHAASDDVIVGFLIMRPPAVHRRVGAVHFAPRGRIGQVFAHLGWDGCRGLTPASAIRPAHSMVGAHARSDNRRRRNSRPADETMQGSRFMVFSTLILTSVAVQPVVAQDPLPRGTTIERVALESRSGQKASGRMELAEAFNPAARTGTMSVVVAPGALHDLIAAMHTSKVGGSAAMEV